MYCFTAACQASGALVDLFVEDPSCRVFLSTDTGGVGLNLQNAAAVVINMDLPWNPAVLEQRIGRVYRLGQHRSDLKVPISQAVQHLDAALTNL